MHHAHPLNAFAAVALFGGAATTAAQAIDPDVDLSNDLSNPTRITLTQGSNIIANSVVLGSTPGGDPDFFTVDTGPNLQIDSIQLTDYNGPAISFIAFSRGETLPTAVPLDLASDTEGFVDSVLGLALVDDTDIGNLFFTLSQGDITLDREEQDRNLLIDTARFGNPGPGQGVFAFVFQETGPAPATYELDIQTSLIPEPTSALLAGVSATLLGLRRRRGA